MSFIHRKEQFSISNKFKFVRQNYRIFLSKDFNSARNNSVLPHKKMVFGWGNVGLIDLIYFDSDEFIKCPICLESDLLVPKISNCGHIYCWPCIIKFMNSILEKDESAKKFKCPICFSNVFLNELVSLRYQIVQKVQLGSEVNLCLLFRYASSQYVHFEINIRNSGENILLEKNEKGAQFQRIGLVSDQNEVLLCDLQMLKIRKQESEKNSSKEEICDIEECISIIEGTLELRGVAIPKYEILSNDTFSLLLSQYSESELLDELECRFVNSLTDNTDQNDEKDLFYFYQLFDGQLVFLEPFYVKVLQAEFGSIKNLPKVLLNVKVISIKEFILDFKNIRRYKFLSHVPMGSTIYIIGIDIKPFITQNTAEVFKDELEGRQRRKSLTKEENYIDLPNRELKKDYHSINEATNCNQSFNCTSAKASDQDYKKILSSDFPALTNNININGIKTDNAINKNEGLQRPKYCKSNKELFPQYWKHYEEYR